jgi:hypothetical protein
MTTIPAVRAALKTLLGNTLTDVQIVDGGGVTTLGTRVLFIGRVVGQRSGGSQNLIRNRERNIPFGTYQDEYTVELIISVAVSGPGEATPAIVAADDLYGEALDAIESSNNLGVAGVLESAGILEVLPTGDFESDPTFDANGRYCTVTFGVDITARD